MIIRLVGWLVHRLGPRALVSLTLLLVALGSVALGLADAIRGLDAGLLLPLTALGLLIGWGLGKSPLPGWLAGLVVSSLGVEAIFLRVGRLGGPLLALLQALADSSIEASAELSRALVGVLVWAVWRSDRTGWPLDGLNWPGGTPVLLALSELWTRVSTLLARLHDWSLGLAAGEPTFDPIVVALVWSLALWGVAAWASWSVRRHDRPLPGMVPAGVLLSGGLFYVRGNPAFLLPVLGATLSLLVWVGQRARQRRWEATGIDFPLDVDQDVAFGGVALSLVLVTVAMLTPSISVRQVAEWAGRLIGGQGNKAQPVASSLGLDPRAYGPENVLDQDQVRAPGLPRRHLLGSGPELSERIVMVIHPEEDGYPEGHRGTDDELTPGSPEESAPRYYWRSLTYDEYTGRGWITRRTETIEYQAGDLAIYREPFKPSGVDSETVPAASLARQKVRLEVRAAGNLGELLYTAGDLVTVDRDYHVAWRSPDDAFGATIISPPHAVRAEGEASPIVYRVDSLAPATGEAQLRAAGSDYPAWVRNRYLALPENVPARVLSLARDLTATAPTPYDRARAIEAYLRAFPYNLDLPLPPLDRDVVDYFLFDLQQGYCDYYATSMVVLARAAGLPARLAVGYFSGTYDEANDRYVVTEADAHAWAEIYFPHYGWVEFEPTAGRAPIDRPADAPPIVPPELETLEPTIAGRVGRNWPGWLRLSGGLALLGLGGIIWSVADGWRLRRLAPVVAVAVLYHRLYRFGGRLGVHREAGDTSYEFAASFGKRVTSLARNRHWGAALLPAAQEARWLVDLYVQMRYSPHAPDPTHRAWAIQTWRRLRWRLWLAWVWQK